MREEIESFSKELHAKLDGMDKRLKDLTASAKGATEKAKVDAKTQLAALESRAKEQHAKVQTAEATTKAWLEEKKTATRPGRTSRSSPLLLTARSNTQWTPCSSLLPPSTKPNVPRLQRW